MGRLTPALAVSAGALAAIYVAACVLPGEPSGTGRIQFTLGFPVPVRVPLAGVVEPLITISADGQALTNPAYRLESLDPSIVRVDSTARRLLGVARGTAAMRVTYLEATGTPDTVFSVRVVVSRIAVAPPSLRLTWIGARARLSAIAFDAADAAVPGVAFTWSSANPTVATVNDTGLVSAVDEGTVAITADADSVKALASVTVTQVAARVRLAPELDTLRAVGRSIQLIAVAFDSSNNVLYTARPRWTSSDSTVARVDSTGRATATGAGTGRIVARVGAAADTATLVVAQVARLLVVTPDFDTLTAIADTARVVAVALDSLNFPMPTPTVTWATSDATIAPVDATGLVTAAANGVVLVTASSGSQSAFATIVVRQEIAAARVSPDSEALTGAGDTVRLSAVAVDRNGFVVDRAAFIWRSSDGFVATVDTAGLVTARVDGTAGIVATARMGGQPDTAIVSVTGAPRPQLAFVLGEQIHILDLVDGDLRSLTGSGRAGAPAWSPDGRRIAFVRYDQDSDAIYLMDADGSNPVRLAIGFHSPAWSPDGHLLAVDRGFCVYVCDIYLLSVDVNGTLPVHIASMAAQPAWSPDGTKLAFVSLSGDDGYHALHVMNADGSEVTAVTLRDEGAIDHPTWSPDGRRIAFAKCIAGTCNIVAVNADGSAAVRLTTLPGAGQPAWSPDGTRIALTLWSGGSGSIVYIPADFSGEPILLASPGHSPAWRP